MLQTVSNNSSVCERLPTFSNKPQHFSDIKYFKFRKDHLLNLVTLVSKHEMASIGVKLGSVPVRPPALV